MNALFDRITRIFTGSGRDPLSFEVEIQNVDVTGLTKQVPYTIKTEKNDSNGNPLYALVQENVEQDETITVTVETTEVTDSPVMIDEIVNTPLLDSGGKQVVYQPTILGKTTTVTDTPVMIDVESVDANGNPVTTQEQEKDESGNLLYWGQIPNGNPLPCFSMIAQQVQKKDDSGNLLYYKQEQQVVKNIIPQVVKEITANDPEYVDGLTRVLEDVTAYKTVAIEDEPQSFVYSDIVEAKKNQINAVNLLQLVLFSEDMSNSLFPNANTESVHFGDGFVTLEPNASIVTSAITIPTDTYSVETYLEADEIEVLVSVDGTTFADAADLIPLTGNSGSLYAKFTNKANSRRDIRAFGVLV